ncbi:uncharacterized protein LOC120685247 [Panicum virgatum]|uniref:uncharacterized protein LOC120685247 n=1 Tax=Panicum virgatum TaxID=38727 RepID=UPI0019D6871D|nr:uncharacterized protein LOC120685247 [Panicum virgatum]
MNRWEVENTEDGKEKIWAVAKEWYKGWRSIFSATYKAYDSYDERMKNKPDDLDLVEWHYLILYFGSEAFQKVSNRNTNNHEQKRTNHCTGSKPFSKLSDEQRDPGTGEEPTDVDLWRITHVRNGVWFDEASQAIYENAVVKIAEKCEEKDTIISNSEENIIFQATYKESTGCKTSTVHGHGYMSTHPTERASMKAQLEEQARAIVAANQKNQELQEHIEKLNDKLENQEAESERKLEEKLQEFKEEESRKIQALRDEFMAALQENTKTTLAQPAPNNSNIQQEATPPIDKKAATTPDSNATEATSVQHMA